jgi:hypothetical protein
VEEIVAKFAQGANGGNGLVKPRRAVDDEDPPSGVISRARGTAISIGPNVPVSDRVRVIRLSR